MSLEEATAFRQKAVRRQFRHRRVPQMAPGDQGTTRVDHHLGPVLVAAGGTAGTQGGHGKGDGQHDKPPAPGRIPPGRYTESHVRTVVLTGKKIPLVNVKAADRVLNSCAAACAKAPETIDVRVRPRFAGGPHGDN